MELLLCLASMALGFFCGCEYMYRMAHKWLYEGRHCKLDGYIEAVSSFDENLYEAEFIADVEQAFDTYWSVADGNRESPQHERQGNGVLPEENED